MINRIWLYVLAGISILGLTGGIVYHIKETGRTEEIIRQYEEREKLHLKLKEEHAKLQTKVSTLQKDLNKSTEKINTQARQLKEKKAHEAERMLGKHLDGTDRLSIPVLSNRPVHTPGASNTTDTRRPPGTTRYELHPETAQFIIDLTKRADKITAERNQCVDLLKETNRRVEEYNELLRKRK